MSAELPLGLPVPKRSVGTRQTLRPVRPWPKGKSFKILSIDGGGILGLFPCLVLAEIERRYLQGASIAQRFDLLVGTSTGGIIVLGLGQGKTAHEVSRFYMERGKLIFKRTRGLPFWNSVKRWFASSYDLERLENELRQVFGDRLFGTSAVPTCIPAFESRYGEPYIFKTPHHPDYKKDKDERLVDIGVATAAAPTYFAAPVRDGYIFADGGIWANNPAMVGVVEALTCFDIDRTQLKLLSLGCGQERFLTKWRHRHGGLLVWARQFYRAATRTQSHVALGQAGLLMGRHNLIRLDMPELAQPINLDDVERAVREIPSIAEAMAVKAGHAVYDMISQR